MSQEPVLDDDDEVRELNEEDFANAQIGDPEIIGPVRLAMSEEERSGFRAGLEEALRLVMQRRFDSEDQDGRARALKAVEEDIQRALITTQNEEA